MSKPRNVKYNEMPKWYGIEGFLSHSVEHDLGHASNSVEAAYVAKPSFEMAIAVTENTSTLPWVLRALGPRLHLGGPRVFGLGYRT